MEDKSRVFLFSLLSGDLVLAFTECSFSYNLSLVSEKYPDERIFPESLFLCTAGACTGDGKWYIIRVPGEPTSF